MEGHLGPRLSKAFVARGSESLELSRDSGNFPRCNRVIASLLCRQESLRSSFGLKIQSYVERCEMNGENIRGRYILNLISTEFDTANASTSITTSLELFQLPSPQQSVSGLRHWYDKVTYILSQLAVHQRPADDMLSHWAYNSLKRHPLLRRVIGRYQELPALRTFDFLWEGVETLRESQHDSNAQSIREDLRKGPPPPSKKSQQEAKGVVAPKGKGKTKDEKKPEAKAKANPKDSKSSDYKGKGKGKAVFRKF